LSEEGNESALRIIREEMEEWGVPVIAARGNHDNSDRFVEEFGDLPRVVDVCAGVRVFAVDTSSYSTPQVRALKDHIEEHPDDRVVVLMHYAPVPCSHDGMDARARTWRVALNALLRPTDLVVAGHNHVDCYYRLDCGAQVVVTARAGAKRYRCREDLPEGFACFDGPERTYHVIRLINDAWVIERREIAASGDAR
jgi:predicted phosphodiesterase